MTGFASSDVSQLNVEAGTIARMASRSLDLIASRTVEAETG